MGRRVEELVRGDASVCLLPASGLKQADRFCVDNLGLNDVCHLSSVVGGAPQCSDCSLTDGLLTHAKEHYEPLGGVMCHRREMDPRE